jgi:predicted permease
MASLWQDIRYSLRMIAKAPGFAAIAILTLALGIGANTTIFSWVNAALLNPIPGIEGSNQVVALTLGKPGDNPLGFTYPDIEAMRDGQQSFGGIAVCDFVGMSLTGKGDKDRPWGMVASANYFEVLGVRPYLGRTFLPVEDDKPGGAPVAVISYRFWQRHFGGATNIIGRNIELNKHTFTIVGVTPPAFQGSQTGVRNDIWVPIMMQSLFNTDGDLLHDHHLFWLLAFGRLKPGVTLKQAQEEMSLRLQSEVKVYPEEHRGHDSVTLHPLWRNPFGLNMFLSILLPILMCIAGAVLLLACANVANLMLVRSMGRRREIAIRMSLGASRSRLVRQLLVESLILALAGGGVALLITTWTGGTLMKMLPVTPDIPLSLNVPTDRTVLLATLTISVLTGVIFGILPALRASSQAPVSVLKEETGTASGGMRKARLAGGLVVAQISLSLLLLIFAGLFIRSFLSAQFINPGFNPHHILIASYDLFTDGYSKEQGVEMHRRILEKLQALPGIQSVALANRVPLAFYGGSTKVDAEGYVSQPHESMEIPDARISPGYFRTLQIPLAEGRDFTPEDNRNSQRVVIVTQAFANRYWPNQEPLGKQLKSDLTHEWFTVVGVTRDTKINGLNEKPLAFLYLPVSQVYSPGIMITARVDGDPLAHAKAIEKAIHELNSDLNLYDVTTLVEREQFSSFAQRAGGTFVGAFGLLALVLAAVGIYGVTAYTTRQRTHEIGIRMTLGATKLDVLRLVLGHGVRLTAIGLAVGLALALVLTRFLSSVLLGVTATDAVTFLTVAIILCAVALFACFLPARRAMRMDPMVALRYE